MTDSALEKLADMIGMEKFRRFFKNAVVDGEKILFPTAFQAEFVDNHYYSEIRCAFGFDPVFGVRSTAPALQSGPDAEILPIEKARRHIKGFMPRELVMLNLPHSDPKAPAWVRRNGRISLIVQGGYRSKAGSKEPEYVGIPYGATARLILFYLMTEALLSKSRKVYLGASFNAFLDSIGATKNSRGKKTGANAVLRQLDRLLNASFRIQYDTETAEAEIFKVKTLPLADSFEIWFSKKAQNSDQSTLWNSYIELSKELYDSLIKSPVPLSWDILLKLRKSPLALDLYAWLSYESHRAALHGKGRFVPWAALKDQMGSEYARLDNFVAAAKKELKKIVAIYPALSVGDRKAGIEIKADSLPSVGRLELSK